MAVLPPVLVPCVEPSHTFTPSAAEPSHLFDACESLLLQLGTVSMIVPLSWILYNSPITPSYYNLYRKKSADIFFQLLATNIQANTYNDSATSPATTYDYQVKPVFGTIEGIASNIVVATTPALVYVYTLRTGGMDIYNVANPASIFRAATAGFDNGGGVRQAYADDTHLYIDNDNWASVFNWSNPLSPTNPFNLSVQTYEILVRTKLSSRNNLLFRYIPPPGNIAFESYDLTNPDAPAFINSVIPTSGLQTGGALLGPMSLCYDPTRNRLVYVVFAGGSSLTIWYIPVAANGVLSAEAQLVGTNFDTNGSPGGVSFIYNDQYYFYTRYGQLAPISLLDGSVGANPALTVPGSYNYFSQVRVINHYVFLGASNTNPALYPIIIYDLNIGGPPIGYIGNTGDVCTGMVIAGNTLVWSNGTSLFVYDIGNRTAPVLKGSLGSLVSGVNGLVGYPSTEWGGNNGGCAT